MRKIQTISTAAALLPLLSIGNQLTGQEKSNRNVLLILCDDMGAMELGCYGNELNNTPNLDQLAEEGVRFRTFYATPVSSPTRVALMTGKYAYKTGWANMKSRDAGGAGSDADLATDEYTFGQMFRDAGFRTGFAGKWQLTGELPEMITECGFDQYLSWIYFGYLPDTVEYMGGLNPVANKDKPARFWHPGLAKNGRHIATEPSDYGPDMFSDFIIEFMDSSVQAGEPFFAYYPMVLMHKPWLWTPDHMDVDPNSDIAKRANVEYTDKIVGKLMDALTRLNIRENTLVIFIGDNGTQGIGKSTVTEWGPRTPCIISCPGTVRQDVVSDELLELSDILPTMLDFTNITPKNEEELDGMSALPLVKGETQSHREFIWSNYGQFRVIREKNWLLEHNSVDGFGDLYYCGNTRNGLNYRLITDYSDSTVQQVVARFEDHIANSPVLDIDAEARAEFDDFVLKKKSTLLKNLGKIYDEDYGNSDYLEERYSVVQWARDQYDPEMKLLKGDYVGGCGFQPDAYNLINVNFFMGPALYPYEPDISDSITATVDSLLNSIDYAGDDRRESIFGNPVPFPPYGSESYTISGQEPAEDCSTPAVDWVVTEIPDYSRPLDNYDRNMNHIVPALLEKYRQGEVETARALFDTALGWWQNNETYTRGFLTTAAKKKDKFFGRDLAYFLIAQKATGFSIDQALLDTIESQLWSLQRPGYEGGLETVYRFDGTPFPNAGHTSGEINALALLVYDYRMITEWFEHGQSVDYTKPTITTIHPDRTLDANEYCLVVLPDYTGSVEATDNGEGDLKVFQDPKPGTWLTGAINEITLGAVDDVGNIAKVQFNISVEDNTAPAITALPGSVTLDLNEQGHDTLPDYTHDVEVEDNCDLPGEINITQSPDAYTIVTDSVIDVTLSATDQAGNTCQETFQVGVGIPNPYAPVINSSHQDDTLEADAACRAELPDYTNSVEATDDEDWASELVITQSPRPWTKITGDTNQVTLTVRDSDDNTSQVNFNVAVVDKTEPTLVCPEDQNIDLEQERNVYTVSGAQWDPVSMGDNCEIESVFNDYNSLATLEGTEFSDGTTPVVWTVRDNAGNETQCGFDVTITGAVGIFSQKLNLKGISIYPNPTMGKLTVECSSKKVYRIRISGIAGNLLISKHDVGQKQTIDLSSLKSGIYIIRIDTARGSFTSKLVKQ